MSRRYSARDREMAAVICSALASEHAHVTSGSTARAHFSIHDIENAIEASGAAGELATTAVSSVIRLVEKTDDRFETASAEAEALIRTGWVPS